MLKNRLGDEPVEPTADDMKTVEMLRAWADELTPAEFWIRFDRHVADIRANDEQAVRH